MADLLLLILFGVGSIGGIAGVRIKEASRWRNSLVQYNLTFPRDLDPESVGAFITGLSGLVAPRYLRPLAQRAVIFELDATSRGIEHRILMPAEAEEFVLGRKHGAMGQVNAERSETREFEVPDLAGELRLANSERPLRVDHPESLAASILASLQPLHSTERIVIQWIVSPVGPTSALQSQSRTGSRTLLPGVTHKVRDAETTRAARAKRSTALFNATIRIGVSAQPGRDRQLLRHVTGAYHSANAPGAHLSRRNVPSSWVARNMTRRRPPLFGYGAVLNSAELTGLLAFPIGSPQLVGLRLGGCRRLMPPLDMPSNGKVIARSNFPGVDRLLTIAPAANLRHGHVIGGSGKGKSNLLGTLIVQDMEAGLGVVVIDPKGDLIADVLDRVPPQRKGDVVVFDPSDDGQPVGLNILSDLGDDRELVVEQVVGMFTHLHGSDFGPRTRDIFHAAIKTLALHPNMTLCEVPLLLTDPGFRRRLTRDLDDPIGLGPFWSAFESLSAGESAQWIGPLMNKLRILLLRERIRNVIGQAQPRFNFDDALRTQKIVLVNLRRGLLGDDAAALLAALVIGKLWQAVSRRSGVDRDARLMTVAYLDEAGDFMALPTNLADLLVQARGLGLGIWLSHQHASQLTPDVRSAILANCGTRVLFQLAASDAQTMAKELSPYLSASDLQQLGPYEVVTQLAQGPRTAAPATGTTLPLSPPTGSAAEVLRLSRERFGRDRAEVEAEIRERHQRGPDSGGRIGRAS